MNDTLTEIEEAWVKSQGYYEYRLPAYRKDYGRDDVPYPWSSPLGPDFMLYSNKELKEKLKELMLAL